METGTQIEKLSLVKKEHIFITLKKGGHNRTGVG